MKKAVWAEFFHLGSTNQDPSHGLCPKGVDSWCKYQKAVANNENYDHSKHTHLPPAVMAEIKPIFRDLSNPELLKKCLHGKSQNPNESVNNIIWSCIPKTIFVSLRTLHLGVCDAVSCFNKGYVTRCLVLKELGLSVGKNCAEIMLGIDKERVRKCDKATAELQKEARQKRALAKRKLEEDVEAAEDPDNPSYAPGLYNVCFRNTLF